MLVLEYKNMNKMISLPSESLCCRINIKNECNLYCNNVTNADTKNKREVIRMLRTGLYRKTLEWVGSSAKVSLEVLVLV